MQKMKLIYIGGFIIISLFGAYYYKDIINGTYLKGQSNENSKIVLSDTVSRKFNVNGMFCSDCKLKIENDVKKIPGVHSVFVNFEANELVVDFKKNQENIKSVLNAVNELGYTVGLKSSSGKLQVLDYSIRFE